MQQGLNEVVIVGATRTAIGKFGGSFTNLPSYELATIVIKEVLNRVKFDPNLIGDVVFGSAYQSGHYPNCARQALLRAGLPVEIPGVTIDRQCISGLEAIGQSMRMIQTGDASVVLAGGAENMSNTPYYILNGRWGYRLGHGQMFDWVMDALETVSGPPDKFGKISMGITAENVAEKWGITRKQLDEYSVNSHMKAIKAIDDGKFVEEIVPVEIAQGKGQKLIAKTDEHPRRDISLEKMSALPTVFKQGGVVTAGNSCGMNDGAAILVLMDRKQADALGLKPLARVLSYGVAGVDPRYMGIGPVPATDIALKRAGLALKDIDLIELNEAFAAQAMAVQLEWDKKGLRSRDIVNVNGGGVALGHPIGCTGVRITVTLLHEMKWRGSKYGLATACVGGGMGGALIIERL